MHIAQDIRAQARWSVSQQRNSSGGLHHWPHEARGHQPSVWEAAPRLVPALRHRHVVITSAVQDAHAGLWHFCLFGMNKHSVIQTQTHLVEQPSGWKEWKEPGTQTQTHLVEPIISYLDHEHGVCVCCSSGTVLRRRCMKSITAAAVTELIRTHTHTHTHTHTDSTNVMYVRKQSTTLKWIFHFSKFI